MRDWNSNNRGPGSGVRGHGLSGLCRLGHVVPFVDVAGCGRMFADAELSQQLLHLSGHARQFAGRRAGITGSVGGS